MSVITTAAGRTLLAALGGSDDDDYQSPTANMIAAIEAEASSRPARAGRTPMGEATFGALTALRDLAGRATEEADRLSEVIHEHRSELRV